MYAYVNSRQQLYIFQGVAVIICQSAVIICQSAVIICQSAVIICQSVAVIMSLHCLSERSGLFPFAHVYT
jgi:hypothetical protein